MAKIKYYFKHDYSETCYTKQYFLDYMKENNLNEINVYRAMRDKVNGIFWCKKYRFCGDGTQDYCGKQCRDYKPMNGKSGR